MKILERIRARFGRKNNKPAEPVKDEPAAETTKPDGETFTKDVTGATGPSGA
jgi:hypothetical protein